MKNWFCPQIIVRFKQIITNLLDNEFKYTENGFVRFGYLVDYTEITFYVKDSGTEINKEKTDIIFYFFQKIYKGAGLGLSLCKSLTNILSGKIRLESEPGKGSAF